MPVESIEDEVEILCLSPAVTVGAEEEKAMSESEALLALTLVSS